MSKSLDQKEKEYLRILLIYNETCDSFGEMSNHLAEMYKKERACQVAKCSIATMYRALNMGKHLLQDFYKII